MCVTSIILSPKKKSVFNVDKIKWSLKKRRNYFLFQNLFHPNQKQFNMAHLPKLGIADSHRMERIEITWLGKMNMTLLCYLQIHILRIAIILALIIQIWKHIYFFIPNLDILTFQVYKNQPLRECRFHNRRFKRWCHNQWQWFLFWRHAVHIPRAYQS